MAAPGHRMSRSTKLRSALHAFSAAGSAAAIESLSRSVIAWSFLLNCWRYGNWERARCRSDAKLTAFKITTLVAAASPRLAVVDDATDSAVVAALESTGVTTFNTTNTGTEESSAGLSRLDDDALILFTSWIPPAHQKAWCATHPLVARTLDVTSRSSCGASTRLRARCACCPHTLATDSFATAYIRYSPDRICTSPRPFAPTSS